MPTKVTYEALFTDSTVPPGVDVQHPAIDVNDATAVNILLAVGDVNPHVRWLVRFGPTPAGSWVPCSEGIFAHDRFMALFLPVYGPQMLVEIKNDSAKATTVEGTYRIVHDLA